MSERVRGHRYAGSVGGRREERHWIAAVVGVAGSVGMGLFSASQQPGGKMTTAQKAFFTEQQQAQAQAQQLQQMLQPYLLEQMGLVPTYGPNGTITGISKRALTTEEQNAKTIQDLAQAKVVKGLQGNLDIDPATERALAANRRTLSEYEARTQGPSSNVSTTSQTAESLQRESDAIIRDQVRRGEMTDAQAIAATQANQAYRQQAYTGGLASGLPPGALSLSAGMTDYPGATGRQNFLAGTLGANRYAAYGNIIGAASPGIGRALAGLNVAPAPLAPPMPDYAPPQYGPPNQPYYTAPTAPDAVDATAGP